MSSSKQLHLQQPEEFLSGITSPQHIKIISESSS